MRQLSIEQYYLYLLVSPQLAFVKQYCFLLSQHKGLVYLDVSIYQMIGNIQFLFVALVKQYVLKNLLYKFHWVGVFWILVSVFIGGSSALLVSRMSGNITDGSITAIDTLVGVALVLAGDFLNALQVVIEEKLMSLDVPVPPLLLIGVQGLWGVVLSIVVMFPVG